MKFDGEAPRLYSRGIFTFFGGTRRSVSAFAWRLRRITRIAFIHPAMAGWLSAEAGKKINPPLLSPSFSFRNRA
ncbi:MAG: hypothetical protein WC659_03220 [Patescibacteria group bacterium]